MGAGASTKLPYTSVEDAKKAGKTQAEIDAWLATNQPAASASAASAATSATATKRPLVELVFNDAIKQIQFDEVWPFGVDEHASTIFFLNHSTS